MIAAQPKQLSEIFENELKNLGRCVTRQNLIDFYGVSQIVFDRWLQENGISLTPYVRITPAQLKQIGLCLGFKSCKIKTLQVLAEMYGVNCKTMSAWIARIEVGKRKMGHLPPLLVERIVNHLGSW